MLAERLRVAQARWRFKSFIRFCDGVLETRAGDLQLHEVRVALGMHRTRFAGCEKDSGKGSRPQAFVLALHDPSLDLAQTAAVLVWQLGTESVDVKAQSVRVAASMPQPCEVVAMQ